MFVAMLFLFFSVVSLGMSLAAFWLDLHLITLCLDSLGFMYLMTAFKIESAIKNKKNTP